MKSSGAFVPIDHLCSCAFAFCVVYMYKVYYLIIHLISHVIYLLSCIVHHCLHLAVCNVTTVIPLRINLYKNLRQWWMQRIAVITISSYIRSVKYFRHSQPPFSMSKNQHFCMDSLNGRNIHDLNINRLPLP